MWYRIVDPCGDINHIKHELQRWNQCKFIYNFWLFNIWEFYILGYISTHIYTLNMYVLVYVYIALETKNH